MPDANKTIIVPTIIANVKKHPAHPQPVHPQPLLFAIFLDFIEFRLQCIYQICNRLFT